VKAERICLLLTPHKSGTHEVGKLNIEVLARTLVVVPYSIEERKNSFCWTRDA